MKGTRFCADCGAPVAQEAERCAACGRPAPATCARCGRAHPAGARFCSSCGAAVGAGPKAPASPLSAEERKYVTIMFVDMIDSLSAIRDFDPEEAQELFADAIALMSEAVHAFSGTVMRTMGDGLMALFGAPAAREDHALAACHAALRILRGARESWRGERALDLRIGLHSGLVVVGRATNDLGVDYDATGVAVHIASRLQAAAGPGCAVVSSATRKLIAAEMETSPLGSIPVKGLDWRIEIFELREGPQARQAAGSNGDEIFVGRASEMADIAGALRSALLGRGRFVAVVGEAGVGKSRFISRFLSAQARGLPVFATAIERYNSASPFHPIRELLLALLELSSLAPERRGLALAAALDRLGLPDQGLEASLADLLGLEPAAADWQRQDPVTRNQMTAAAARAVLLKESERRPLVLVIEDVQRADSATLGLIGGMADALSRSRILLIVSLRPDFEHRWAASEAYRQLRLDRLSTRETDRLIDELVGETAAGALRRQLAAWSRGNPLLLHETVRAMVDSGILGGEVGARVLLGDPGQLQAPHSIAALIAERIDRLDAELKETLLAASVLGEQFSLPLLARIAQKPPRETAQALAALEEHEFVRRTAALPQPEFAFSHALVQEVCYSVLLKRRRRQLHAAALETMLDGREATPSSPQIGQLAHHAYRGGQWARAVDYCRAAGRRARFLSANREAVRQFENALAALVRADPEGSRLRDHVDLSLELRAAHVPLLHLDAVGRILADVRERAAALGDRRLLAQVTGFQAGHAYLTESAGASRELSLAAIALAREAGDRSLEVAPAIHLGQALHALGRFAESARVLQANLALAAEADASPELGLPGLPSVMTARWVALSLAELGSFAEAEGFVVGAKGREAAALRPFDQIYSQSALGFVRLVRGEFEPARRATAEAMRLTEERDLPFMIPVVASQLGLLLAYLGEAEAGVRLARRAVRAAEDIGISAGRSRWYARLGEAYLLSGDLREAAACARRAIEIARRSDEQGYWAYAERLRGRVALARGDLAEARADLAAAVRRARRLDMAPLIGKCAIDLGAGARLAGRPERARRRFLQAQSAFGRLGMRGWADRAQRELDDLVSGAPAGDALRPTELPPLRA